MVKCTANNGCSCRVFSYRREKCKTKTESLRLTSVCRRRTSKNVGRFAFILSRCIHAVCQHSPFISGDKLWCARFLCAAYGLHHVQFLVHYNGTWAQEISPSTSQMCKCERFRFTVAAQSTERRRKALKKENEHRHIVGEGDWTEPTQKTVRTAKQDTRVYSELIRVFWKLACTRFSALFVQRVKQTGCSAGAFFFWWCFACFTLLHERPT